MTFLLGMLRRLPEGYAEPKSDEKTVRMGVDVPAFIFARSARQRLAVPQPTLPTMSKCIFSVNMGLILLLTLLCAIIKIEYG